MKRRFDEYIKSKLHTPQQPPADAWQNILEGLQKEKEKKRPFLPFWLTALGLNFLLLLVAGGSYLLLAPENNLNKITNKTINEINEYAGPIHLNIQYKNKLSGLSTPEATIISSESRLNETVTYNHKNIIHNDLELLNSNHNIPKNEFSILNNEIAENQALNLSTISHNKVNKQKIASIYRVWDAERLYSQESTPNLTYSQFISTPLEKVVPSSTTKKQAKIDLNLNRFHISGFISPMAFNTFIGKSMLSDDMNNFKTKNSISLAYGFKGAYSLSPKVKIRTGISVVDLEQITQNIPISSQTFSPEVAKSISENNINYSSNTRLITGDTSELTTIELERGNLSDIQQLAQYIEIPLEAEVQLFKTGSIGISATAGGSTWLLSKNKINILYEKATQELGKANNLNDVSFSANAGIKFDFQLFENINLDLEPQFKYLVNPVNNIDKFSPFMIGVNAGITLSFK